MRRMTQNYGRAYSSKYLHSNLNGNDHIDRYQRHCKFLWAYGCRILAELVGIEGLN